MNSSRLEIYLSVIVYLETYHWYNLRDIDDEDFEKEISELRATPISLHPSEVKAVSENSIKSNLRFKHHVRDIIIGTHAIQNDTKLITLNTKHFTWMANEVMTPSELVLTLSNKNQ